MSVQTDLDEAFVEVANQLKTKLSGPAAALNQVGWVRAVYIANGAAVPTGLPAGTLVIEMSA